MKNDEDQPLVVPALSCVLSSPKTWTRCSFWVWTNYGSCFTDGALFQSSENSNLTGNASENIGGIIFRRQKFETEEIISLKQKGRVRGLLYYYLVKCNRKPKHEIFINSALKTPIKLLLSFFKMNMQSMISKLTVSGPQGLLKQFIFTSDMKGKNECKKSQRKLKSLHFRLWFWFALFYW